MVSPAKTTSSVEALLKNLPDLSPNDRALIERAYHKAETAHSGQVRKSGEPYFTHCYAVATILTEMKLDAEAIAAALMHDIIEDTPVTIEELRDEFGGIVVRLVDGVTKLAKLPINVDKDNTRRRSNVNREHEYFRKMMLMMGDDVRVVLIKLADRLHNMRTLGYMPPEKQARTAQETLDIFAPLANRLGIWQVKSELEDLAFRYIDSKAYKQISTKLEDRGSGGEDYVQKIANRLRQQLEANGIIDATITARPKHKYSIYRKMNRKDVQFDQIYDVRAIRVIVEYDWQCYLALGVVHNLWRPIPGEFDDYIASPKDNFYRSLHTAVLDNNGKTVEVQIRTWEMHENAEYGIAAHWRYKEGKSNVHDKAFEERIAYLRRLMEFGPEVGDDAEAFIDTMKTEVFEDRVYAFTPNGDIIDLPVGATAIDFAYHIHTEIGHRCRGAKVHGRLVPLNYHLKTGDQVEILTSKRGGPSMDWLNYDLGYVKTARARSKIKYWFRKQNREKHITMGRDGLERELKRLGLLDKMTFDAVANLFDYARTEDFLAGVGAGDITSSQIFNRILEEERRKEKEDEQANLLKPRKSSIPIDATANSVMIQGTGGMLVSIARCCRPMAGDDIIGYITRGRGVTVHRADCSNVVAMNEPERLIEVSWGGSPQEQRYSVPIEIIAYDREGLMRDISAMIADEQVNISDVRVSTRQHIATLYLIMDINNDKQLTRILSRLDCIPSVVEARRRNMA